MQYKHFLTRKKQCSWNYCSRYCITSLFINGMWFWKARTRQSPIIENNQVICRWYHRTNQRIWFNSQASPGLLYNLTHHGLWSTPRSKTMKKAHSQFEIVGILECVLPTLWTAISGGQECCKKQFTSAACFCLPAPVVLCRPPADP